MTDATPDAAGGGPQPTVEQDALAPDAGAASVNGASPPPSAADRPELTVAAAFAGGFTLALLLKRLAR